MEEKKLQDIEFPLVFKICIAPSFNVTAIAEAGFGYMGGFSFFRLSKSVFLAGFSIYHLSLNWRIRQTYCPQFAYPYCHNSHSELLLFYQCNSCSSNNLTQQKKPIHAKSEKKVAETICQPRKIGGNSA